MSAAPRLDTDRSAWEDARALADAVLYEGYVLYPYRANSGKNQVRFQWGVVSPPGAEASGAGEGSHMQTSCLLRAGPGATVDVGVRFLQVQRRTVEVATGDGFAPADRLDGADQSWVPWDEAVEHELVVAGLSVEDLLGAGHGVPIAVAGGIEHEEVAGPDGATVGRVVRCRWDLDGRILVRAEAAGEAVRLVVSIDNLAPWSGGRRDEALATSLVSVHTLLSVSEGSFVSMMDPPAELRDAAAACENVRTWPVLVGPEDRTDTILSSPIILYDHAEIAPESQGDLFDATEIDELLTLRVMTLTDEEKADARATDVRAAAIIDQSDLMPPEILERLHGAVRGLRASTNEPMPRPPQPRDPFADAPDPFASDDALDLADFPTWVTPPDEDLPQHLTTDRPWWDPAMDASVSPESDVVFVGGMAVARGSKVILRPSRRADAQDMFLDGRTATVQMVIFDVDDGTHVAVTIDDDPAAEYHDWQGRYHYFDPDEIVPVTPLEQDARPAAGVTLVAGIGNIFLGDDGFGSELARRMAHDPLPDGIEVRDYGVGGVHLAHDLLDGFSTVILVDALQRGGDPGDVHVLEVGVDDLGERTAVDGHAMDPATVLANLEMLGGELPRTFVVGVEPADLSERIGLSVEVEAAMGAAKDRVMDLLANPPPAATAGSGGGRRRGPDED